MTDQSGESGRQAEISHLILTDGLKAVIVNRRRRQMTLQSAHSKPPAEQQQRGLSFRSSQ